MFLARFFSLIAAFIVSFHHNTALHKSAVIPSHATVLGKSVAITPPTTVVTPTVTPITTSMYYPQKISEPEIDCTGPDGKHLFVTQKICEGFNDAWHQGQNPTPTSPWGMAQKVGDHTYTMKFTPDVRMATPQEIFDALNNYRQKNGIHILAWDTTLAQYAQSRANFFEQQGTLDHHAGFSHFLHDEDGFSKLGFNNMGENASYAGPLVGAHLIEWIFAGDEEHNANQLNATWTHVGIGVNGIATDMIFGAGKR